MFLLKIKKKIKERSLPVTVPIAIKFQYKIGKKIPKYCTISSIMLPSTYKYKLLQLFTLHNYKKTKIFESRMLQALQCLQLKWEK